MGVKVQDLMVTEILTCREGSPLSQILSILHRYKKQLVVFVVDDKKKVKGLITPRRLLQTIMLSEYGRMREPSIDWSTALTAFSAKTAGEIMGAAITVQPDQDLEEVISIMVDKNLYALPVVDKKDNLIGRISIFDIVAHWLNVIQQDDKTSSSEMSVNK